MKPNYIIFTDGSVRKWETETRTHHCGSYAVVVLDLATMRYTSFGGKLKTNSSVYTEVWAIYRGLQYLNRICKSKNQKSKALVISDSKIVVSSLTTYVSQCWNTSNWNKWMKSDGTPVKHQEIYRNILKLIAKNDMTIRIGHMNSHLKPTHNAVNEAVKQFRQSGINVSNETMLVFIKLNTKADEIAANITQLIRDKGDIDYLQMRNKLFWEPIREDVS